MMRKIIFFLSVLMLSSFLLFWRLDQVDLEASEDIYVSDSVGYMRGDPFIVPRHHLRKPHYPASPHPFFVQLLTGLSLKIFGFSLFSIRFVQALAIILTTFVVMLIALFLSQSVWVSVSAGLFFTTLPLVVRFGRMAVLDPVLTFLYSCAILWSWSIVQNRKYTGYLYAGLTGFALGLVISTKLTGIFFSIPISLIFVWQFLKKRENYFIKCFIICFLTCGSVFILFNDPYSYYYGWTHFSDPKHARISFAAIIKAATTLHYWFYFITGLLGMPAFILFLISLHRFKNILATEKRVFVFLWTLGPLTYLIINPIHVTGLSAEWSYLPLIVPFAIILSFSVFSIQQQKIRYATYGFYFIATMPTLFWYGLRFERLPLAHYLRARNVITGDLAVTRIIDELNKEHKKSLVLVITKGIDVPLWMIKDSIATEPFYHPINLYDYILTDNEEIRKKSEENGFMIQSQQQNFSEPKVFLLKNATKPY